MIIVSDSAKMFMAAKRILRDLFESDEVINCLTKKGIDGGVSKGFLS